MSPVLALGQRVYSRHGQAAQFLMFLNADHSGDRFVVQPFYQLADGSGEYLMGVETWHEAFTEPPRKVVDEEVAKLAELAASLRTEIETLTEAKKTLERRRVEVAAGALDEVNRIHSAVGALASRLSNVAGATPAAKAGAAP